MCNMCVYYFRNNHTANAPTSFFIVNKINREIFNPSFSFEYFQPCYYYCYHTSQILGLDLKRH